MFVLVLVILYKLCYNVIGGATTNATLELSTTVLVL